MASQEELSKRLNLHLNELGFNEDRIRERIFTANKCSRAKDISNKRIMDRTDVEKIFAGSTREGIGFDFLNDLDVLQIDHSVVCQTGNKIKRNTADGKTYFKIERNNAPPGYCFLRLISKNTNTDSFKRISYAVVKRKTEYFISSDNFMTRNDDAFKIGKGCIGRNTHYQPRQGPSIPKYVDDDVANLVYFLCDFSRTDIDFVRAFPFDASELLSKWVERKRLNGWPSDNLINHVKNLPAYVVPTGQKGSKTQDLQWRISFNIGEIHLIQNFNNIQTKVFVLLKLLAKHILLPVSKRITSYVVKNVMLWVAEQTPPTEFCEEKLMDRLKDSLIYLKESVEKGMLKCYMIPQRNLFVEKFQTGEQQRIVEKLNQILDFGKEIANTYYFSYESNAACMEIDIICGGLSLANHFDKVQSCRIAMFSTEQLAEYFVTMFLYESRWKLMLYNFMFHFMPYVYTYGIQGLSDPLSIPLIGQLEKEEPAENERWLNQKKLYERFQPLTNKPSCLAIATCSDECSIQSSIVMLLLYNLFLGLIIDFGLSIQIPGLKPLLLLFRSDPVRLSLTVIFYSTNILFDYRKTFKRMTFLKRNQFDGSEVIPLLPKGLINLEEKVETVIYTLLFLTTTGTTCTKGTICFQNTLNFIPNSVYYFIGMIIMRVLHAWL